MVTAFSMDRTAVLVQAFQRWNPRGETLGRRWNTGAGLHNLKKDRRQPGGRPRSSARKESSYALAQEVRDHDQANSP